MADKLVDINYSNKDLEWASELKLTQTVTPALDLLRVVVDLQLNDACVLARAFYVFIKVKTCFNVFCSQVNVLTSMGCGMNDELHTTVISCIH